MSALLSDKSPCAGGVALALSRTSTAPFNPPRPRGHAAVILHILTGAEESPLRCPERGPVVRTVPRKFISEIRVVLSGGGARKPNCTRALQRHIRRFLRLGYKRPQDLAPPAIPRQKLCGDDSSAPLTRAEVCGSERGLTISTTRLSESDGSAQCALSIDARGVTPLVNRRSVSRFSFSVTIHASIAFPRLHHAMLA